MPEFRFHHLLEVRYGDLDPQGVVNNATYLTYFEQARVQYLVQLGLFSVDQSFLEIGVIVADVHVAYYAPLLWGVPVKAGVRTAKIGNKSMTVDQCVVNDGTDLVYASGTVILVAYDYLQRKSIPVPEEWKQKIGGFDEVEFA
jgi:acyl-CoA thioester hydrolase